MRDTELRKRVDTLEDRFNKLRMDLHNGYVSVPVQHFMEEHINLSLAEIIPKLIDKYCSYQYCSLFMIAY